MSPASSASSSTMAILRDMISFRIADSPAFVTGADAAQMVPGVNAGRMAVVPCDMQGVVAGLLDGIHFDARGIHLKRIDRPFAGFLTRFGAVRAGAGGAG